MLTESSKPTIAKNANVVAVVTARKALLSSPVSNIVTRPKSALPWMIAQKPIRMMISSPESSTSVSTTLALTLSPTPRRLIAATSAMKASATSQHAGSPHSRSKPSPRKLANALDAVDADVMPEHITVKQTMNVTKWIPNALCAYSAAPAACGYFVTSSR